MNKSMTEDVKVLSYNRCTKTLTITDREHVVIYRGRCAVNKLKEYFNE